MYYTSIENTKDVDISFRMEECISNKDIRNEMIRYLRKNSNLTLKEMGQVFGGISDQGQAGY